MKKAWVALSRQRQETAKMAEACSWSLALAHRVQAAMCGCSPVLGQRLAAALC
jgi:hypothetical protein